MNHSLGKTIVVSICAAALAVAALSPAGAAKRRSPEGQVEVVTANLREAFEDGGDLRRLHDMDVFVRRVLDKTTYVPDVLVLQEVNKRSAAYVARKFSKKTGDRYSVVVAPPERPTKVHPAELVHTETAIVLNKSTMRSPRKGGYLTTTYDRAAAAPGTRIQTTRQAHGIAIERAGRTKVAIASVHFPRVGDFRAEKVSNDHRGRWASKIAQKLANGYRSADLRVIGGDFNASRCYTGKFKTCNEAAYWRMLVRKKNYRDSIRDEGGTAGVDYIFAKGRVISAGVDTSYNADAAARGAMPYYSDHMFRWAVLAGR